MVIYDLLRRWNCTLCLWKFYQAISIFVCWIGLFKCYKWLFRCFKWLTDRD